MDPLLQKELAEQRVLLEQIHTSVEKTRKYILWTVIATVVAFVVPLILAGFAIPAFLNTYTSSLQGLGI